MGLNDKGVGFVFVLGMLIVLFDLICKFCFCM